MKEECSPQQLSAEDAAWTIFLAAAVNSVVTNAWRRARIRNSDHDRENAMEKQEYLIHFTRGDGVYDGDWQRLLASFAHLFLMKTQFHPQVIVAGETLVRIRFAHGVELFVGFSELGDDSGCERRIMAQLVMNGED